MDRLTDRKLGLFWERQFGQIIVPYGFSAQETVAMGIDRMIWPANGSTIHVQIRHKNPMKIVENGGIALYVIHDYTRYGRLSAVNEVEDWVAQYIQHLAASIDLEREGPTWFGDYTEKQIMPICYWHVGKFEPLDHILEDFIGH